MSSMVMERFVRRPQVVQAVVVTEDNLDLVASWCDGHVTQDETGLFVKVPVKSPFSEKQTKAYPGDRVVMIGRKNFKVFTEKAFGDNFVPYVHLAQEAKGDAED